MSMIQNEEMQALTEAFHRGEMTQTEYRNRRRQMLEQLEQSTPGDSLPAASNSGKMIVRTIVGTLFMVALLGITIVAVNYIW